MPRFPSGYLDGSDWGSIASICCEAMLCLRLLWLCMNSLKDVIGSTGLAQSTIYKYLAEGTIPETGIPRRPLRRLGR